MNCQDARESLASLLDGDIGLTERVPLELHVSECAECRQKLVDLQALRLLADKAAAPRPAHHWHWPPVVAVDTVGRALGFMRRDDFVTRMRRLMADRFPSKHLAIAAAVPLVAIVAIFVFERGFKVGVAMRQRAASEPVVATQGSPSPAPPRAPVVEPVAPAVAPPALPPRAAVAPPPPPAVTSKPVRAAAPQAKAADTGTPPRSTPADAAAKPARPPAPLPAAPVKASLPASAQSATGKPVGAAVAASSVTRSADVIGRLRVKSRGDAERDLGALVARAGGTFVSRQRGPTTTVVEASIPHASYGTLAQGMTRLGAWQLEAERSPLPDLVHITVRLAE